MSSKPSWPRRLAAGIALVSVLAAGSCSFLRDEFVRLDRAGPVADGPPDRAPSMTSARDGQ